MRSNTRPPEIDYKENYRQFWKELIENPDGSINLDQVMRELSDYSTFMDTAARVYCHITDSRISKVNTLPEVIISVFEDIQQSSFTDWFKDELENRGLVDFIDKLKKRDEPYYPNELAAELLEMFPEIGETL
jgi:hypothetical protein